MTKLKQKREAANLKLREVAEKAGVTPQTVQQQEKRGILSVRTAKRYAVALNRSWQEIMG